jgi:hypothetical protein
MNECHVVHVYQNALDNVNIFCTWLIYEWNESFKQHLITKHLYLPGLKKPTV